MQAVFGPRRRRNAQTLVFFLLAWGTIMLLCGLAIDSGLLYLAKARLGRAVDGAALVAVGSFDLAPATPPTGETTAQAIRDNVATIMRNFAVANFTALSSISGAGSSTPGGVASTSTGSNGQPLTVYTYNFNDETQDANGQYRRFVQVVLTVGSGGAITGATCNARCPVQTYFIGYATYAINGQQNIKIGGYSGPSALADLKVSSSAVATRNPRLIMIVIDRSASMLANGGGASGLPPAVVQFLDFFDTSSDNIGIVSFGTSARLEMPLTTNFIIAGTNNLIDAYNSVTNSSGGLIDNDPGVDPEDTADQTTYDATGVRRLKFGGSTCADDGIRLAMEQLMANSGFNDPDVIKYMVIFTDGKWNTARTLFAAPGYTNEVVCPSNSNTAPYWAVVANPNQFTVGVANGQATGGHDDINNGPWSTNLVNDTNLVPMPSLGMNGSSLPFITNAIATSDGALNNEYYASYGVNHTNDTWQSADGTQWETLANPNTTIVGDTMAVTNTTWVSSTGSGITLTNYYTHNVDVWLQPGSVAFLYHNGAISNSSSAVYVSDYTKPNKHINIYLNSGDKVDLVVPGYIVDGTFFDGLDLEYPDNSLTDGSGSSTWPRYRSDNYQQAYMWEDDSASAALASPYVSNSLERQLMFRNYVNLLTGFYVSRPEYPLGTATEPLITDSTSLRPQDPLGPYYPGAAFYWPFGGGLQTNSSGVPQAGDVSGADGVAYDPTYSLVNPLQDPGVGEARHNAYSINMLSTNAAPEWAGELFYKSISGGGVSVTSGTGTTAASEIMQSADWQNGEPPFMSTMAGITGLMTNEPTKDSNIAGSPSVWRPLTFNGSNFPVPLSLITPSTTTGSHTGGYVSDGNGNYYENTMAWSGRPTHYFDFTRSKWIPVIDNHDTNIQALPLGNWKAGEYAWHARALGVTIFTVGYGTLVTDTQQAFLAGIANATNTTAGGGSNISYNPSQPIGQQFYATNATQISNDFYSVGQAINAALTGGG